jgi:hypothetical protein
MVATDAGKGGRARIEILLCSEAIEMVRSLIIAASLCLAVPAAGWAADQQMASSGASPQDQEATLRHTAEKVCSAALDHDRFNYGSMEDCVDDTMAKLKRSHPK